MKPQKESGKKETPILCEGCPNNIFFKDGKECWIYWENKKKCATKDWLIKDIQNG